MIQKKPCQYCGAEFTTRGIGKHTEFCKSRPKNSEVVSTPQDTKAVSKNGKTEFVRSHSSIGYQKFLDTLNSVFQPFVTSAVTVGTSLLSISLATFQWIWACVLELSGGIAGGGTVLYLLCGLFYLLLGIDIGPLKGSQAKIDASLSTFYASNRLPMMPYTLSLKPTKAISWFSPQLLQYDVASPS